MRRYNISEQKFQSLYSEEQSLGGAKMWSGAGGVLVYDFLVKIYLYIQSKNTVIYCTTGQSASDIRILENIFCLVN